MFLYVLCFLMLGEPPWQPLTSTAQFKRESAGWVERGTHMGIQYESTWYRATFWPEGQEATQPNTWFIESLDQGGWRIKNQGGNLYLTLAADGSLQKLKIGNKPVPGSDMFLMFDQSRPVKVIEGKGLTQVSVMIDRLHNHHRLVTRYAKWPSGKTQGGRADLSAFDVVMMWVTLRAR